MYQTYSLTTPTGAIDSAVVCSSRVYLSSLIGMLLLVKAMAPKWTLVVVSSTVTPAVQILESVRTGRTSCSGLSRRVRLSVSLAAPNQELVVLNSVRTTTFLTLSTLSATGMCWVMPAPAVATLGHSRVHSSPSDCSCVFFFLNHQFVTWCSIAVRGRLFTTSSLQFWPQETKTSLIGRETQLESIEIKEKSK